MSESHSRKVILITGASSGIGEALAIQASLQNYHLSLMARGIDKLHEVAVVCRNNGAEVLCIQGDVSKESECKQAIEQTIQTFKRLDVLINNAGISMRALLVDCDVEVIEKVMQINFFGTVYCTKHALPHLLKSKGSVVGISSIAGVKGLPARTGYSASKFAMHGFLESLRIENLKTGLHVLLACPGYTASNIRNAALNQSGQNQSESPLDESKLMTAEEVAEYILRAIQKRKRYLYLTFQGKLVVFLSKFFSKFLDKMVYNTVAKEKDSPFK
jgi:short-subunit dehydrogenase